MTPSWTATSREPGQIPKRPTILSGRSNTKVKAQLEAATLAAKKLDAGIKGPVNVALSGFASTKQDTEPDQIHVHVVEVGDG